MTEKDFTYAPVFSQLLSPAPSVTARGSHSFARHTVYSAMQRGSREQKMLLGPMSVLATKEQATPTWKKSRVQPKNFAFTVWVLSLFRKTSVTAMVNCFRLPLLAYGVRTKSSPFCLILYCCQSLDWLRAISINGVLPVASFSQVAVACSTNGL